MTVVIHMYELFTAGPKGPPGPRGATGASGRRGTQGPIGLRGPSGYTGASGARGDSAHHCINLIIFVTVLKGTVWESIYIYILWATAAQTKKDARVKLKKETDANGQTDKVTR